MLAGHSKSLGETKYDGIQRDVPFLEGMKSLSLPVECTESRSCSDVE